MWYVIESKPFIDGWHIEMICDALEAVQDGRIRRLLINIPPRHMKSLLVSVFYPMWVWLRDPSHRWLYASYAQSLSNRDSVKCRRIFQSNRYQQLLMTSQPDLVLVGDQNTKVRYDNNKNGYRLATSVDGTATGEGGDTLGIDDAHNVKDGESEVKRQGCISWWDEVMSSRLNDAKTGAIILVMQRCHEEDLSGHIISKNGDEYDQLILPARYEGENRVISSIGLRDPRTREGQLLWEARFDSDVLTTLERSLGPYATAGQLQQRPAPRGGGDIRVDMLTTIQPDNFNWKQVTEAIRYWDKAGTEGGGARTAGVLLLKMMEGCGYDYIIADVKKGQWSYGKRESIIKHTAEMDDLLPFMDKVIVHIYVEQEPGSGGKESADRTIKALAGHAVHKEAVRGDKSKRAEPFGSQVEAGNCRVLAKDWTHDYLSELGHFPVGKYKDQVDATSGAFNNMTIGKKQAGAWGSRRTR